jgi:hypothetical protein
LADDAVTDLISASFLLNPPTFRASAHELIYAQGQLGILNDQLFVNFDYSWIDMGVFEISFRDATMGRLICLQTFLQTLGQLVHNTVNSRNVGPQPSSSTSV